MKNNLKRVLSLVLATAMVFTYIPTPAYATDLGLDEVTPVVEIVEGSDEAEAEPETTADETPTEESVEEEAVVEEIVVEELTAEESSEEKAAADEVADTDVAKIGEQGYATLAAAIAAAQSGDEVVILKSGTYALDTSGKDITITGAVDGVVFDNIGAKNMGGANVTFNNVTFDYYPNVNYTGLQHSGNFVYNNCTINGQVFLYGASETFNKCTFNQDSADAYNVWTYGAKEVEFNECTFNSAGKSVLVYSEQSDLVNNVTVTDCDFIASAAVDGKAAIEMDSSYTKGINLTIDAATTATGFGAGNVSGNSLWNNKKGNEGANNDITVAVGGDVVLKPIIIREVSTKAELDAAIAAANNNDIIRLIADIDYTGTATPEINKAVTLDLGGFTLTTHGTYGGLRLRGGCTLKNGTLAHKGTVTAIKAWDVAAIEDIVIDVAFKAEGKVIGGIVIQENTSGIGTIKNVTIKGEGLTNGIETYNCGNATAPVIGSMENVTIDAVGTAMNISAPVGTATNCSFKGGVSGIEIWIKGTYSAILDLKGCTVEGGKQAVFAHDEFSNNPDIVNNGKLELTADNDTTFSSIPLTLTIARAKDVNVDDVIRRAVAKVGDTYYASLKDAIDACTNGETVELISDITYDADDIVNAIGGATGFGQYPNPSIIYVGGKAGTPNTPSNVNAIIDLNGHKITNNADAYLFMIMDNAKVTFTDSVGGGKVISNADAPVIWTVGTETLVTIKGGTYETASAYGVLHTTHGGDLVIEDGTFKTTAEDKSLLIMLNSKDRQNSKFFISGKATVSIKGGTFEGFNPEKVGDDNGATSTEDIKYINGCAEGYAAKDNGNGTWTVVKAVTIGSVADLLAFGSAVTSNKEYQGVKVAANSNVVVTLTADLDLAGSGFTPIGDGGANAFAGIFDGKGHTISNMTLSCNYYRGVGFFRSLGKGAIVKNVTFVNANIDNGAATSANHFYGVVAGFSNNLTLDNVDVKDSSVKCKYSGAVMVGCIEGATTIKNCDIENVTVKATNIRVAVYGILGNSANGHTATLENNTITNAVSIIDGEVKTLKETLKYNEWADGTEYTESTLVAKIGETKYSTLYDAVTAATAGQTITLIGDVVRVEPLVISKDVTLDLNGETITTEGEVYPVIRIQEGATLTVKGGTIENNDYVFVLGASDGTSAGNLVIENGTYEGNTSVASVTKGELTVLGGNFSVNSTSSTYLLNCIDANYKDGSANIVVKGGTFEGFNPENNAAEGAGTNFVAKGYRADANADNTWTVVKDIRAVNTATTEEYYTVAEALAAAKSGETVKMVADSTEYMIMVTKGVTLDLNGKMLTADYIAAFKGNHIVDNSAMKTALVKVEKGNMLISKDNEQFAVWSPADERESSVAGYIFAKVEMKEKSAPVVSKDGTSFEYQFRPVFETVINAEGEEIRLDKVYFTDGATDNDIEMLVRLTWNKVLEDGTTKVASQEFVFEDEFVKNTGYYLRIKISGITEKITNLKVVGVMKDTTGAEFVGTEHEIN